MVAADAPTFTTGSEQEIAEKQAVYAQFVRFAESGFRRSEFTPELHERLQGLFGFRADGRESFYANQFAGTLQQLTSCRQMLSWRFLRAGTWDEAESRLQAWLLQSGIVSQLTNQLYLEMILMTSESAIEPQLS